MHQPGDQNDPAGAGRRGMVSRPTGNATEPAQSSLAGVIRRAVDLRPCVAARKQPVAARPESWKPLGGSGSIYRFWFDLKAAVPWRADSCAANKTGYPPFPLEAMPLHFGATDISGGLFGRSRDR
jgi:hypothetical protein